MSFLYNVTHKNQAALRWQCAVEAPDPGTSRYHKTLTVPGFQQSLQGKIWHESELFACLFLSAQMQTKGWDLGSHSVIVRL